jgi:hypothetical protein
MVHLRMLRKRPKGGLHLGEGISACGALRGVKRERKGDLLAHVLLSAADLTCWLVSRAAFFFQTADTLSAEDVSAEETEHWVGDVFSGCWAPPAHCLFHQCIVILWETD